MYIPVNFRNRTYMETRDSTVRCIHIMFNDVRVTSRKQKQNKLHCYVGVNKQTPVAIMIRERPNGHTSHLSHLSDFSKRSFSNTTVDLSETRVSTAPLSNPRKLRFHILRLSQLQLLRPKLDNSAVARYTLMDTRYNVTIFPLCLKTFRY